MPKKLFEFKQFRKHAIAYDVENGKNRVFTKKLKEKELTVIKTAFEIEPDTSKLQSRLYSIFSNRCLMCKHYETWGNSDPCKMCEEK